jgi:hypothetical protein
MWVLKFLPDWIFYVILLTGFVGLLVGKLIPGPYKTAIQAASAAFFVAGLFMSGAIYDNDAWVARVKEMEAKVEAAAVESAQENVKIVEKVVKKTEYIKTRGEDIVKYIDREIVKYDIKFAPGGQCELPKEFIQAHNLAAEAPK